MVVELLVGMGLVAASAVALRALRIRHEELMNQAAEAESENESEQNQKSGHNKSGHNKSGHNKSGHNESGHHHETARRGANKPKSRNLAREEFAGEPSGRGRAEVGDVLLYADAELWLAGCLDLDAGDRTLKLFRSPGTLRADWVGEWDDDARGLVLFQTTDAIRDGRVPDEMVLDGFRFHARARGSALCRAYGDDLPFQGSWFAREDTTEAEYVVLLGAGERSVLVVDIPGEARLALSGTHVGFELLDHLPGASH